MQTKSQNLDLALIGNCRIAALVDRPAASSGGASRDFDSDPVFSRLLAGDEEKGFCDVVLADLVESESRYVRNTAIVETDPRRRRTARRCASPISRRASSISSAIYRPPQIVRRIEPLAGLPRITIRVRPTHDYGRPTQQHLVGSNHIRYIGGDAGAAADDRCAALLYRQGNQRFR